MSAKIITITSGKGGVGKTTATANISVALAMRGQRVVAIDADIGLRNLDVVMGLENRIVFNIVDVVKGKCRIQQAAIKDRRIKNLFLIPASQSDNKNVLIPEDMMRFGGKLKEEFDYVLIDCPAGIERGFENSVASADEAIVICTPEVASVRDADRVIGLLYARSITPKLLVNRIVAQMVERGDMLSHEDIVDVLSVDLLGLVPMDDQVVISTNTGSPLVTLKDSQAGEAFRRIARRIEGEEIPIEIPRSQGRFWKKISTKFGLGR